MNVELYTDAGLKDGLATWATVARIPGVEASVEASGVMRDKTKCSTTAEARAVANALHKLARLGVIERGATVTVYTDSQSVVERIEGRGFRKPQSPSARAVAAVHAIAVDIGVTIKAVWIRGHQADRHSRHAPWNNRCDALCRAARSAATKATAKPKPSDHRTKPQRALDMARRLSGAA